MYLGGHRASFDVRPLLDMACTLGMDVLGGVWFEDVHELELCTDIESDSLSLPRLRD